MTKGEAAEQILGEASYDTALPQDWLDDLVKVTGRDYHATLFSFVWAYDNQAGIAGRPCALTNTANIQLAEYNAARGCSYPLTENPIEEGEE